jgi:hypothetical protein
MCGYGIYTYISSQTSATASNNNNNNNSNHDNNNTTTATTTTTNNNNNNNNNSNSNKKDCHAVEYYEGYWRDNERHGQGTHVFASGVIQRGEFVHDVFATPASHTDLTMSEIS